MVELAREMELLYIVNAREGRLVHFVIEKIYASQIHVKTGELAPRDSDEDTLAHVRKDFLEITVKTKLKNAEALGRI